MWTRDMKIGVVYPTGDPEVTSGLRYGKQSGSIIKLDTIILNNHTDKPKQMKDLADGDQKVLSTGPTNNLKIRDETIALHEQFNYEIKTAEGKWVPLFSAPSTSTQASDSPASKPRQFSSPQKPISKSVPPAANQPTTAVSATVDSTHQVPPQQKEEIKIERVESSLAGLQDQLSNFKDDVIEWIKQDRAILQQLQPLDEQLNKLSAQFENLRQISANEISELKKEIESINDSQEEFDEISDEARGQLLYIVEISSKSEKHRNSIANQLQEVDNLISQGRVNLKELQQNKLDSDRLSQEMSTQSTESTASAKNIINIGKAIEGRKHIIEELDQVDSQLRAQENIRDDQDRQRLERNCLEATERLLQNRVTDLVGNAFTERLGSCRSILDQLNQFTEKLNTAKITPPVLISNIEKSLHQTIQSCELTERKFRLPSIPAPEEFHHDFARSLVPLLLSEEPPEDFPTYETLTKQRYWDSLLDYKDLLYEPNFKEYVDRVDQETKESVSRVVVQLAEGFSEYRDQTPQDKKIAKAFTTHFLPAILAVVDLEIIPLEVGVTMADSQIHEIQGTTQGKYQSGVIAEVVMPGLRQISDQTIVRKPIVFRGIPLFSEL